MFFLLLSAMVFLCFLFAFLCFLSILSFKVVPKCGAKIVFSVPRCKKAGLSQEEKVRVLVKLLLHKVIILLIVFNFFSSVLMNQLHALKGNFKQ